MTERLITALDGVNDAYLAECQAAREQGNFAFGTRKPASHFWEPFGYVAAIAVFLCFIVMLPGLLPRQPSGYETTETQSDTQPETPPVTESDTTTEPPETTDLPSRLSDLLALIEADYLAYHVEQNGFDPTKNPPLTVSGFYGVFNGAVAVMMGGFAHADVCLDGVVADSVIHYGDSNTIQVWKAGVFYELDEAYEGGLLTKNDVELIALWHNHNTFLTKEDIRRATALLISPDAATRREIEEAFARQNHPVTWPSADTNWYGTRCYGQFGSVTVLFEAGMLTWIETKTIAGVEFTYSSSFGLWGYYNGSLYTLQEAYDNGYITKEQVAEAAANHSLLQRLIYRIPRGMDLP